MKRIILLAVILLVAGNVAAQSDPVEDGIGFYFDMDGLTACSNTPAPYATVTVYLLITNPHPDLASISSWEGRVWMEGNVPLAPSWTLAGGTNVDPDPGEYEVHFDGPLGMPAGPTFLLLTFSGIVPNTTDVATFHVAGRPDSTWFPDSPGYAAFEAPFVLHPLDVFGYAVLNDECGLPAEESSFGALKALYR